MAHGGYRTGAGRKKGGKASHTLKAEESRSILVAMLKKEVEPIGRALIAKAKSGDVAAARELMDRAWGKPIAPAIIYDEAKRDMEADIKTLKIVIESMRTAAPLKD